MNILNKEFKYTSSYDTDIRKTFKKYQQHQRNPNGTSSTNKKKSSKPELIVIQSSNKRS